MLDVDYKFNYWLLRVRMSENNNETKNYKKPLFNRPKESYQIFEGVIIQSEKGGFNV